MSSLMISISIFALRFVVYFIFILSKFIIWIIALNTFPLIQLTENKVKILILAPRHRNCLSPSAIALFLMSHRYSVLTNIGCFFFFFPLSLSLFFFFGYPASKELTVFLYLYIDLEQVVDAAKCQK